MCIKSVARNLLKFQKYLLFAMIVLIAYGCARGTSGSYNPYNENDDEIPPPDYEGRKEKRVYDIDEYTTPPAVMSQENRITENLPKGTKVTPAKLGDVYDKASYKLGPGDMLEVIYQLKAVKRDEEYKLNLMDEIQVSFFYTPKMDRRVVVKTDGKINLPLIGDIEVYEQTAKQVEEVLVKKYSSVLKDPVIEVSIVKSNWAIEELKRAITTAPRGQSRLEPIRPDGYISLPLIGDALVAGLTVPQASERIRDQYISVGVRDIDVTVVLLEAKSPVVYVFGEVLRPGSIVVMEHDDLWRTIGMAGGFTAEADKRHVIVSKVTEEGEARLVLDFDKWKSTLDSGHNTEIVRGDIIYVPKINDRYVYLFGAVEKPGRISLDPEMSMTASQALSLGGRLMAGAKEKQVLVLRRSPEHDPIVISVDIKAVFNPKNYDDKKDYPPRDPYLQPGDIIYVPNQFIGDLDRFADAYFKQGIWTIIPFNLTATYNLN